MTLPPTGLITLVFTDVEGSTALWERVPNTMRMALALHDNLMRLLIDETQGYEVKTEGDAFMVAFASPHQALRFCVEVQQSLHRMSWPADLLSQPEAEPRTGLNGLRVRMGLHQGAPDCKANSLTGRMDYFGPMVNRSARIASAAHGGQILASHSVWTQIGPMANVVPTSMAALQLKGIRDKVAIVQLAPSPLVDRSFPSDTAKFEAATQRGQTGSETVQQTLERAVIQLLGRGQARWTRGSRTEALADFQAARTLCQRTELPVVEARILSRIALAQITQGSALDALDSIDRAFDCNRRAPDRATESELLNTRGGIHVRGGRYVEANRDFHEALQIAESIGYGLLSWRSLANLCFVAIQRQEPYQQTADLLEQALDKAEALGNAKPATTTALNLAMWELDHGFLDATRARIEAFHADASHHTSRNLANVARLTSWLRLYEGHPQDAISFAKRAQEMPPRLPKQIADLHALQGAAHMLSGDLAEARTSFDAALDPDIPHAWAAPPLRWTALSALVQSPEVAKVQLEQAAERAIELPGLTWDLLNAARLAVEGEHQSALDSLEVLGKRMGFARLMHQRVSQLARRSAP